MQSTPEKNLSFSDSMNLSRLVEPFSSIPSKHIFRLIWRRRFSFHHWHDQLSLFNNYR